LEASPGWNSRRRSALSAISAIALLGLLLATALTPSAEARVEAFQGLASSPVELTAVATDPATGLIYAQEDEGTSFFVYDPRTNAWSERAPSPVDSGNNGGAAYLGGKIYVVYTENSNDIAIYDIATNSWNVIDNPLNEGTGNITSAGGKLYLAVFREFVSYDPATGAVTPLAEPPAFAKAECNEQGFEPWGGLQVDGGKIYGHQGNGCTGFAVYDIATNSWLELPLAPEVENEEGPILGSAINPVTNTYLTYGPYSPDGGRVLYRWDIEAGAWSTSTLPFGVEDGGMAYVALPGYEGVYMIQGENGTEFTRYTERNVTDLSPSMTAGVAKDGRITYSIQVRNNGPERASGVVLSDPLPARVTLISAVPSQGTCAAAPILSCNLGVLRSGGSAALTLTVKAPLRSVTNAASVTSNAVDSNPGNDSASVLSTQCVVPKLRKRGLKGAKKALRKANCKPGKVSRRYSGKVKEGKVLVPGKRRGKVLPAGSKVKLVVSRGPKNAR